ncbi:MAG: phospholipid carrier-dependent glycosyltransferase, partial [Chloroflexi bacterium]|nr:phospholipid carrier-dependent glycosyltransferase [Chloroflexota bacterium]
MTNDQTQREAAETAGILVAVVGLLIFFALAMGSMRDKSLTFDEGFYVARGWAFMQTGELLTLGHPPLAILLVGLGVSLEASLPDPRGLDGWLEGDPERVSEDLLWGGEVDFRRVTFLGRITIIWLGVLLGALLWRWAKEWYGPGGASLALALYALSPNLLAHTRLATTDLPVAAFYVATLYAWMRFLRQRSGHWLWISGIL